MPNEQTIDYKQLAQWNPNKLLEIPTIAVGDSDISINLASELHYIELWHQHKEAS